MEQSTLAIIIFALTFISFALEIVPVAISAAVGAMAMAFAGILEFNQVYSGFGSETVIMVAGMMIIGAAFNEVGVTDMIGYGIAKCRLHHHERIFVALMFLFSALLSGFFSNCGTVALMFPLIQGISKVPGSKIRQKNVLMPVGMAAGIGGGLTLIGTTPQLIASEILQSSGIPGTRAITFWETGYVMLPLVLVASLYFLTFGYRIETRVFKALPDNPLNQDSFHQSSYNGQDTIALDKPKWKMCIAAGTLTAVVIAFMLNLWDTAVIAMAGATFLVVSGCISWKKALQSIDWNTIVVLGCSLALADGLNRSGGGLVIANAIVGLFGGAGVNKYFMLTVLILLAAFLTNFIGNVALVASLIPITLEIAGLVGANPVGYTVSVTVACLLAIATPIGTASVTQTLVGGYKFIDYVKIGLPINIVLALLLCLLAPIVYVI